MGGWDAPWHWVVLAIIVIALFGYKKLPDAARALGRSLRIFKTEIKGMTEDEKARARAREQAEAAANDEPRALPRAELVKNENSANGNAANRNGSDAPLRQASEVPAPAPRPRPSPSARPHS